MEVSVGKKLATKKENGQRSAEKRLTVVECWLM
jgi:hypothetical protein